MMIVKRLFTITSVSLYALFAGQSAMAVSPSSLSQVPLFLVQSAQPLVMLSMSNDHQLFYKAYDDWSDIDANQPGGDADIEITYKHSVDYYGYFDAYKCYTHNGNEFEPVATTTTKYCSGGQWSGNFLNWASMARIDTVRKILFGGQRSTDTSSKTVLERTYLPGDAHSFAKYYQEQTSGEIARLTPWAVDEITLCNITYADNGASETITAPPLIRVARGNFALWAANERHQCHWDDRTPAELEGTRWYCLGDFNNDGDCTDAGERELRNNGNEVALSGLNAYHSNPSWAGDDNGDGYNDRLGDGDYIARVEVCKAGLIGTENCKTYPQAGSVAKPVGLLQQYGDDGDLLVGLMTGSFGRNVSGGTLRKNISALTDEIAVNTDGTFVTAPSTGDIISTLSRLRVSGYDHDPGYYNIEDSCSWGINSFTEGNCSNWGNPQSEIYLETLRYLAEGPLNPIAAGFAANDSSYLSGLGSASTWSVPLSTDNYCAPINVIQFNASVTSYDGAMAGSSDLLNLNASSVDTWTDTVGDLEGFSANSYFVGGGTTASTPASLDGQCTAKTIAGLSDASGICPEAPRLGGDFDIAGLAYYAKTSSIRDDIVDVDGDTVDINVKTYGVSLAPAVPKIEVLDPSDGSTVVATILPACRNQSIDGNCAIVDFKVVEKQNEGTPNRARFYVNWEDSEQGGDYDQDMAGYIEYTISGSTLNVSTRAIGQSTPYSMGFGYIISGAGDDDGLHVHSGINGFNEAIDPTGIISCSDTGVTCSKLADESFPAATTATYTVTGSTASLLPDPLLLAAKYGGFEEDNLPVSRGGTCPDNLATSFWNEATDTYTSGCDLAADEKCYCVPDDIPNQAHEWQDPATGLPNTYFFATNPAELETSLAEVFLEATKDESSASSTAANSQRVSTDTTIYQARFDSGTWAGELLAYPVIEATGALSANPSWDAGEKLELVDWDDRVVFTNSGGTGVEFAWDSLSQCATTLGCQQDLLNTNPVTLADDGLGEKRLEFLLGDDSWETQNCASTSATSGCSVSGTTFRDRARKLGDLVNSSPAYVGGEPGFAYPDWLERYENTTSATWGESETPAGRESYSEFKARVGSRESMLYVGGNGGMLHGFTASPNSSVGGVEKLAFVPNAVYPYLSQLTSTSYQHRYYVDGTPTFGDVMFADGNWRTILVGGLNAGGQGIYALNITDPEFGGASGVSAADTFLWEIEPSPTSAGNFYDLGYTYSRPSIVKNHSGANALTYEGGVEGQWVVVFGNGYASVDGRAVLYIVDAETGAYVDSVTVGTAGNNGLTTVSPVDLDGDYKIDVIYGGDLQGNLWKFIPDGTGTGWEADFNGSPLYAAPSDPSTGGITNAQPITMRPEVGRHPDGLPGVMVYFGTGSYFKTGDNVGNADTHSVYGIWDVWNKCYDSSGGRLSPCQSTDSRDRSTNPAPGVTPAIDRDHLVQQCVTGSDGSTCLAKQTTAGAGDVLTGQVGAFDVRVMSDNAIPRWDWEEYDDSLTGDDQGGYMGWYIDLPDFGEKQVTRHQLRGGRLIFVSIIPSDHACEDGGESWLMEVDARTGGRLDEVVFDLNGDGRFDFDDNFGGDSGDENAAAVEGIPVSGKKSKEGIIQPPSIVADATGTKEFKYASGSKGGVEVTEESAGSLERGRKSWVRIK
jgi:type IV pilus assembly protein PilY1